MRLILQPTASPGTQLQSRYTTTVQVHDYSPGTRLQSKYTTTVQVHDYSPGTRLHSTPCTSTTPPHHTLYPVPCTLYPAPPNPPRCPPTPAPHFAPRLRPPHCSNGVKQRTHRVHEADGGIYVHLDTKQCVESDEYARNAVCGGRVMQSRGAYSSSGADGKKPSGERLLLTKSPSGWVGWTLLIPHAIMPPPSL